MADWISLWDHLYEAPPNGGTTPHFEAVATLGAMAAATSVEESVFRGVLLPRSLMRSSRQRRFVAVTISTALFVLMHVGNAVFVGLSDTSQFLQPSFLAIVAALGHTCSYLYLKSGSLWAPIALHWATVVTWNLFLGRDLSL